ncbi:cytochrome P450 [Nonomuraea sp. NPDC050404]|uniref:cytochrome P450 n=1 Tax=Nonomuraea sp. NPDC050404 TaxID=3155783 RepID=UPI0033E44F59
MYQNLPAFPMRRTCPFDPPPGYAALRAERPVARVRLPNGQTPWLVTGYDHARRILTDERVSSDRRHPGHPSLVGGRRSANAAPLVGMDPPEHGVHRRMLAAEFTVKRLHALRPRIRQIAGEFVGRLHDSTERPADLVRALSLPVPSLVICELLGVPYADHDFFESRAGAMLGHGTPPEEAAAAFGELRAYVGTLVTRNERRPEDGLLGRLVDRYRREGMYDHDLLAELSMVLLVAGHETTANMISLGTVALLEHPGQLAEVMADPALIGPAVEELLRHFSVADAVTCRVALADIEIGGVVIGAGEGIIVANGAANHDPARFDRPAGLDLPRGARHHLALGYGVHQCLGQNLARLELEIVFSTLFTRIPGLRLAVPAGELPFKHDSFLYGVHEVPVTW